MMMAVIIVIIFFFKPDHKILLFVLVVAFYTHSIFLRACSCPHLPPFAVPPKMICGRGGSSTEKENELLSAVLRIPISGSLLAILMGDQRENGNYLAISQYLANSSGRTQS